VPAKKVEEATASLKSRDDLESSLVKKEQAVEMARVKQHGLDIEAKL
jgi:hypothetical protein